MCDVNDMKWEQELAQFNLIDIGALGGLQPPWNQNAEHVGAVLAFEPNESESFEKSFIKLSCAVWNKEGNAALHISKNDSGSSLLQQNYDWVGRNYSRIKSEGNPRLNRTWFERSVVKNTIEVETKTLDGVLTDLRAAYENVPETYHFLKSDTQGGEKYVLEGAEEYVHEECLALELEMFRYPLYKDMALDEEIIQYLDGRGFELVGRTPKKGSFESQYDALFCRKEPRCTREEAAINQIKSIYGVGDRGCIIDKNAQATASLGDMWIALRGTIRQLGSSVCTKLCR